MLKVVRIKTRNQNHQKYLLAPQKMENAPALVQRAAVECSGDNVQLTLGNLIKMVSPGHY